MIIGIGVDVVDLERFASTMRRQPSITRRVFSEGEQVYCDSASAERVRAERYAARFAAKEAVGKALGCGIGTYPFASVEVVRNEDGAPSLAFHGKAAERASAAGADRWHLSLTHGELVTIAFVVAEGTDP